LLTNKRIKIKSKLLFICKKKVDFTHVGGAAYSTGSIEHQRRKKNNPKKQ
jgi:hypothetical protein